MVALDDPMDIEDIAVWIKGKRGRGKLVADALGVTPDFVSKSINSGREWKGHEILTVQKLIAADAPLEDRRPTRSIPLLGSVPAGDLREAFSNARRMIDVPADMAPTGCYALIVEGDSMNMKVDDGAQIIVDPSDLDLFDGRYYVVRNEDGETTFKRFRDRPARLEPCSTNDKHKPIPIGQGGFTIIGRVLSATQTLI